MLLDVGHYRSHKKVRQELRRWIPSKLESPCKRLVW